MRHLLGYFTGHTADTPVDTPCLYSYNNPWCFFIITWILFTTIHQCKPSTISVTCDQSKPIVRLPCAMGCASSLYRQNICYVNRVGYFRWCTRLECTLSTLSICLLVIRQGGKSARTDRYETVKFPIAFTSVFSITGQALTSYVLAGSDSNFGIQTNFTTIQFTTSMYDNGNYYAGFHWIAIGI